LSFEPFVSAEKTRALPMSKASNALLKIREIVISEGMEATCPRHSERSPPKADEVEESI
jgi:hypothetical protein